MTHLPNEQTRTQARATSILRAVVGWLILCAGIGFSVTFARLVGEWFNLGQGGLFATQALLVSALVVPVVLLLRRKIDRKSLKELGLARRSMLPVSIGMVVGLGTACLVWLPALWAGWLAIETVDLTQLMMFIVVNVLLLIFYEALPEELALRGYAWTTIKESWTPFFATLVVTALFPLSSLVISVMQTLSAVLLRVETSGIALVPSGSDPIAYFLQLIFFGLALSAARRIPIPGALAICIAFHVVQLSINRILLGGFGWFASGVKTVFVEPDAIALVLVHIMIGGITFLAIRKTMERHNKNHAGT